jgi:hypothetical protein
LRTPKLAEKDLIVTEFRSAEIGVQAALFTIKEWSDPMLSRRQALILLTGLALLPALALDPRA